jgi:hypothetical protein
LLSRLVRDVVKLLLQLILLLFAPELVDLLILLELFQVLLESVIPLSARGTSPEKHIRGQNNNRRT